MDKPLKYTNTISFKLMLSITVIIIVISSSIGILSYYFAKNELVNSGKLDLQHIAQTAIPALDLLNKEVESGKLSLAKAKEMAREKMDGPEVWQGGKKHYDFSKSPFLYKQQGYLYAYNQNGRVEMQPNQPIGANQYNLQDSKGDYVIRNIIKASHANNQEGHYYSYYWKNPGDSMEREKIAYVIYYKPWGWSIGIGAYTDEFYSSLESLKLLIALISLGIALVSLLTFYFIARTKMKLLMHATMSSLKIAGGELNLPKLPEGNDEIGRLAVSFNIMSTELKNMLQQIKEASHHVLGSASDLAAISEETTASSQEINTAMQEISASTMTQSEEIENTFKQMELMTNSIKKIHNESSRIKEITSVSKAATKHGKEIVAVLHQANNETEFATEKINSGITILFSKVKDISHIAEAIQYITEQTNLLALNASIEAARAGEHGKGFAVVANEVRKLAEESSAATKQIQEMINGIENEMETTVQYMNETAQSSKQLNQSVMNTETEFSSIEKAVSMIIEAVEHLNEEMNLVNTQTDEMLEAAQKIAGTSQQTAASTEEITASLDEESKALMNVSNSADGLINISEELNSIISKFHFD